MASGSYFQPPVRRVGISKSNGGVRPTGFPTVSNRMVSSRLRLGADGGHAGAGDLVKAVL